jgi:hypothetical protein
MEQQIRCAIIEMRKAAMVWLSSCLKTCA